MTPIEKDHAKGLNGALAAEIRAEIAAQGRTNIEVAKTVGMDRVTFQRYVNTVRGMNTAITEAIADALNVDPGELMVRAVRRLSHEKATSNVVEFPQPPTADDAGSQAAYRPEVAHESIEDDGDHAE